MELWLVLDLVEAVSTVQQPVADDLAYYWLIVHLAVVVRTPDRAVERRSVIRVANLAAHRPLASNTDRVLDDRCLRADRLKYLPQTYPTISVALPFVRSNR